MADETRTVERTEDFGKDAPSKVNRWLAEIKAYNGHFKKWTERCEKIVKRYRDEQEVERITARFNILWANTQIMAPALYGRKPVPDVSRRHKDRDPIGRAAATILERCLGFSIDVYDFDGTVKGARDDYLLTARGQGWVRYVPHFGEETQDKIFLQAVDEGYQDDAGKAIDAKLVEFEEDGNQVPYMMGEKYSPVAYEEVVCDHIPWPDFGHTPAPKWEKVAAVWKRELLNRDQLVERFGKEKGEKVSLTEKAHHGLDDEAKKYGDVFMRAPVYEIWHKPTKKVIWISPGYTEDVLDEKDDPLKLNDFFPCPRPIYGTMTTDTLVPVPDYAEYQDQADELDRLTQRITLLIDAIRVVGVYNAALTDLSGMLKGHENTMIAVDQWAMFAKDGGLKGAVDFFPVQEVAAVLQILAESRERIKQDLFEISGISDIVRGQVDPREKLGQSQMKGQFANLRLQDRQAEVNRFVRDLLRIKGEIISEHFSEETILEMSGWLETQEAKLIDARNAKAQAELAKMMQPQQALPSPEMAGQPQPPVMPQMPPPLPPTAKEVFAQAIQMLRQDRLRTFRVDIESDSTAFEDRQAEKESRAEFLTAVGGYMQQAMVVAETDPTMKPLLGQLLLFGIRGFKVGRQVEAEFEEALEDMKSNPPQQQQGDPAMMVQAQADQAKTQLEGQKLQLTSQKDQATLALEQQKFMHTSKLEEMRFQAEEAARQRDHQIKMAELDIRRVEAASKLTEAETRQGIEAQRLQLEGDKNVIEREKIQDGQAARKEQQEFDFTMREGDKEHEGEIRRLDGKVTPQVEGDMFGMAEAVKSLGEALNAFGDRTDKQMETLSKTLTAPKKVIRDKNGKAIGVEVAA